MLKNLGLLNDSASEIVLHYLKNQLLLESKRPLLEPKQPLLESKQPLLESTPI
jgi:hypothetical protein